MFYSTTELLKVQSEKLSSESAYYSENKMLSYSSFKNMLKCPANHILGEKPDWDKTEFLIGHGAEAYALEGAEAFEYWLNNAEKDGNKVIDSAMKQPSKASITLYEKIIQAQSWNKNSIDWKLPNGKVPTSSQEKAMTKIIDEHGMEEPVMPQPTEYAWVEQARITGRAGRRSKWMEELLAHKDTKLQHAICIKLGKVEFKMRLDLINPTLGIILDFKTVGYKLDRNSWKVVIDEKGKSRNVRINFVEDQQYLLQAAIYTMGANIEFGEVFQYYIAAAEKCEMPRFEILEIPYEDLEDKFKLVDDKKDLFYMMLNEKIKPMACGLHTCKYCAPKRSVNNPINWREI